MVKDNCVRNNEIFYDTIKHIVLFSDKIALKLRRNSYCFLSLRVDVFKVTYN